MIENTELEFIKNKYELLETLKEILTEFKNREILSEIACKRLTAGIDYLMLDLTQTSIGGKNRELRISNSFNEKIINQAKVAIVDEKDVVIKHYLIEEANIINKFITKMMSKNNKNIISADMVELATLQAELDLKFKNKN